MTGVQCSFCGKKRDQVKKLIAGPTAGPVVHICDECVGLCQGILDEDHRREEPAVAAGEAGGLSSDMDVEERLRRAEALLWEIRNGKHSLAGTLVQIDRYFGEVEATPPDDAV